ncbi:MAG: ABC transporter substrate-binding protein [Ramlibacter sp.]|nr:ABC transporter substrate-binding protein [Ramlibacter sp.]
MLKLRNSIRKTWAAALVVTFCLAAQSAELRIGFKAEVTSADPHVQNGQNRNVWIHVYDALVAQDENLRPIPSLATSWKAVGTSGWEFKLRPGVKFHDGTPLTAEDVKFSLERAKGLTGPRTYRSYLRDLDSVQITDATTVLVKTKSPSPTLPDNLSLIAIVSRLAARDATEESFAKAATALGTGPYKFQEWLHGQRVVLARNDAYWGGKEPWEKVSFNFIPKDPARASALLANAVDVIDGAPSALKERFAASGNIDVASTTSYMMNYLWMDRERDVSPYVTGTDGQPLSKNPFHDLRVRQAVNLAINRDAITRNVMKGDGVPAGQYVPAGFFGHVTSLLPPKADIAQARKLLAEAGYPKGFQLALHCSNDRYPNDAKVCEAVGQMLSQAGIKAEVNTLPFAVFQSRSLTGGKNGEPEFSMGMLGIGAVTGDSLEPLMTVSATHDKKRGTGANNRSRYSSKELDAMVDKASSLFREKEREEVQQAAAKVAIADVAIVPLQFLTAAWASRKGITVKPRADGFTLATGIRPGPAVPKK